MFFGMDAKAVFGIPTGKALSKTGGMVVRFNGVNLTASKKIWPILSMVGLSLAIGSGISMISGFQSETKYNDYWNGNGNLIGNGYLIGNGN